MWVANTCPFTAGEGVSSKFTVPAVTIGPATNSDAESDQEERSGTRPAQEDRKREADEQEDRDRDEVTEVDGGARKAQCDEYQKRDATERFGDEKP